MKLAVIVTRTQPGADETAARLDALGYTPVLSPMLETVYTGLPADALQGVRDLIFSSANGVRAFAAGKTDASTMTAWCVGPSTSDAARAAGFARVLDADGDVHDLFRLIQTHQASLQGPLLHIANTTPAGRLTEMLREAGLEARFAAAYRTEGAPRLSDVAQAVLSGSGPAFILLHSAKAAQAVAETGIALDTAHLVAISQAAATPLRGRRHTSLHIAARPNEESILAALDLATERFRTA